MREKKERNGTNDSQELSKTDRTGIIASAADRRRARVMDDLPPPSQTHPI